MYVLGLMSGTSADGVDAALVDFKGNLRKPTWRLINKASVSFDSDLQKIIVDVGQGSRLSSTEWLELSEIITEFHYRAAKACDPKSIARVVGCHGQTVSHRPPKDFDRGASLQLIQAPLLATFLNRPVVFDFRAKNLALGGQGAPLSPLLDLALLGGGPGWRGVLNLGGIANLSLLPPRCGPDRNYDLMGWDCGPANSLIDFAARKFSNGKLNFDSDGLMAAAGNPDLVAIEKWLEEDFFQLLPPKSTGREVFGCKDLERRLSEIDCNNVNDVIATLTCFTASIVAQDLDNLFRRHYIKPIELFVAGGGSKNPVLMKEISKKCKGIRVLAMEEIGISSEAREAMAFAFLAWWYCNQKTCTELITGAERPTVLGSFVKP